RVSFGSILPTNVTIVTSWQGCDSRFAVSDIRFQSLPAFSSGACLISIIMRLALASFTRRKRTDDQHLLLHAT
ncbi:MAG: hypothetical protein OXH47_00015, partial [Paracoccaceae bacterium]|nr:hypothetical protein [Paracoccaceae bacterium]